MKGRWQDSSSATRPCDLAAYTALQQRCCNSPCSARCVPDKTRRISRVRAWNQQRILDLVISLTATGLLTTTVVLSRSHLLTVPNTPLARLALPNCALPIDPPSGPPPTLGLATSSCSQPQSVGALRIVRGTTTRRRFSRIVPAGKCLKTSPWNSSGIVYDSCFSAPQTPARISGACPTRQPRMAS